MRSVVWASIVGLPDATGEYPDAETVDDGGRAAASGRPSTALRIWRDLARRGDAAAEFWLGWAHHYGQGVPADPKEAMRCYRRAAAGGDVRAEAAMGLLYENGSGVRADADEAARRYAAAAAGGEPTAAFNLAALRGRAGAEAPQDRATAAACRDMEFETDRSERIARFGGTLGRSAAERNDPSYRGDSSRGDRVREHSGTRSSAEGRTARVR